MLVRSGEIRQPMMRTDAERHLVDRGILAHSRSRKAKESHPSGRAAMTRRIHASAYAEIKIRRRHVCIVRRASDQSLQSRAPLRRGRASAAQRPPRRFYYSPSDWNLDIAADDDDSDVGVEEYPARTRNDLSLPIRTS